MKVVEDYYKDTQKGAKNQEKQSTDIRYQEGNPSCS